MMARKQAAPSTNSSGTPWRVTPAIRDFCHTINPGAQPIDVPTEPWANSAPDWCFENTKAYLAAHPTAGHSIVNGWSIWETPGIWLEAEAHSIIRSKHGKLVNITQHPDGYHRILFLSDTFDRGSKMVRNRYYPLRDDAKLHELIEAKRKVAEFLARYPVGSMAASAKAVEMLRKEFPDFQVVGMPEDEEAEYKTLQANVSRLMAEANVKRLA